MAGESNRGVSRKLPIDKETVNGYVCGGNAVIRGIKRVSKPAAGSRRGAWGDAGVREHTTPFM